MSVLFQLAFDGLTIGLIYIILAAGLVLVLSVTEIFFVAYGQFYMWGAYVAWYVVDHFNMPYVVGLIAAIVATAVMGLVSYQLIFKRMQHMDNRFLITVTAALGISLILAQAVMHAFGTQPKSIPNVFAGALDIGGVHMEVKKLALIGIGDRGHAHHLLRLREDQGGAGHAGRVPQLRGGGSARHQPVQGVPHHHGGRVRAGRTRGAILAPAYNISSGMGNNVIATVLLMTMLGGMDSLLGAVVGGLIVGEVLSFGQYYVHQMNVVYLFLFIGVVIYFRPNGLLGHRTDLGV